MSKKKSGTTKATGKLGEQIAADFLSSKGYTIITRNFQTRSGEIDIIARDGDTLVFIEVKTRKNEKFGKPIEQIDEKKANRIRITAEEYIVKQNCKNMDCRLDAISVNMDGETHDFHVEHFINSFMYSWPNFSKHSTAVFFSH